MSYIGPVWNTVQVKQSKDSNGTAIFSYTDSRFKNLFGKKVEVEVAGDRYLKEGLFGSSDDKGPRSAYLTDGSGTFYVCSADGKQVSATSKPPASFKQDTTATAKKSSLSSTSKVLMAGGALAILAPSAVKMRKKDGANLMMAGGAALGLGAFLSVTDKKKKPVV
jgi:hypothetical protein